MPHDRVMERRTAIGCVGLVVTAGATAVAAGPVPGAGLGALVAVTWFLLSEPYAFAAGHAGFLVDSPDLGLLLVAEAGLLLLLLSRAPGTRTPGPVVAAAAVPVIGTWMVVHGTTVVDDSPWSAVGVLLLAAALASYVIDRYQRLRFGLLER